MVRSLADFVVSIGTDGCIVAQGSVLEVLGADKTTSDELRKDEEAINTVEDMEEVEKRAASQSDGKLIVAEEIEEGHVSWKSGKFTNT
jgi:hypothetical protein